MNPLQNPLDLSQALLLRLNDAGSVHARCSGLVNDQKVEMTRNNCIHSPIKRRECDTDVAVAESGKCSSILAYLDRVADNLRISPTHDGTDRRPRDQPWLFGETRELTVSPRNRRRPRIDTAHEQQHGEKGQRPGSRYSGGGGRPPTGGQRKGEDSDHPAAVTRRLGRAPWDDSTKRKGAATATGAAAAARARLAATTNARSNARIQGGLRGQDTGGLGTFSPVSSRSRRDLTFSTYANEDVDNLEAARRRGTSRLSRRQGGHHTRDYAVDGVRNSKNASSVSLPFDHRDSSGGSNDERGGVNDDGNDGESYGEVPDDSSTSMTAETTVATAKTSDTTVSSTGGEKHTRRWVWDEWDVDSSARLTSHNNNGTVSGHLDTWNHHDDSDDNSSINSVGRKRAAELFSSPEEARISPTSYSTAVEGRSERIPAKLYNITLHGGGKPIEGEYGARQAFEDVQATARSMKEDLRQRRSEVLELKTSLQRVRASNERRRDKISEKWMLRAKAAAVEREDAAERQRVFARQLEKDVGDMEERLGGLERQVSRLRDGRDRDCALTRSECTKDLKKAREAWMTAEKGRLHRLSEKKAAAIKQAAARALEPQLSELVMSNRAESRAHAEDLETTLNGLQARLEKESDEKVQTEAREYQATLEAEVEEERRLAEHQLRLLARANEAELQEFREATRRDLEGDRVRFEADRKRGRNAAAKELEGAREAEAETVRLTLAEHARELWEAEEAHRREEEDTHRRLAKETERWQRQMLAAARKEAAEKEDAKKRELREKCNEELDMVVTRLEAEAAQAKKLALAEGQREATTEAEERARVLERAQGLETKAMERYLDGARRQAELESETRVLEQEIEATSERLGEESARFQTAEEQLKEGRERWQARLASLREECATERAAVRDEAARLMTRSEEAEGVARHAASASEEEMAGLRASLMAEVAQVQAKITAVLKRKSDQAAGLSERLSNLKKQTKAREDELSDYRRRTFR